jgi:hypothetical protein
VTERPIGGPEDREGNPRRLSEDDFVAATSAQPVKDIPLPGNLHSRLTDLIEANLPFTTGSDQTDRLYAVNLADTVLPFVLAEIEAARR